MSVSLEIRVFKTAPDAPAEYLCTLPLLGPTELGRQEYVSEDLYKNTWLESARHWRVVIAYGKEPAVGRHHALLEPLPDGRLQVSNISSNSSLYLENAGSVAREGPRLVTVPAEGLELILGTRIVRIHPTEDREPELAALPQSTLTLGQLSTASGRVPGLPPALTLGAAASTETEALLNWLQTTLSVLQLATTTSDFFEQGAQAVVDLADMDSGRFLLWRNSNWEEAASVFKAGRSPASGAWEPSTRVLAKLLTEKKTVWEKPRLSKGSMAGVQAVVAAPILDREGRVIGALYGDRRFLGGLITRLEAMLVELVACGVAAGLARVKQEQSALLMEQFFPPQLARQLTDQGRRDALLQGRQAEVTLLFCDVRSFSKFSERLGPVDTVRWISDVMAELSDCVIEHQGVLVDYIGDELLAMWGAPEQQPDHARLACRTALAMLDKLHVLNARWFATLKEEMAFGIGINSGQAHVGNTGSHRRFKYGPLGNTVNLASRVQGATKHLKTNLLITGATYQQLDESQKAQGRRLGTIRVVNIHEPVDVYQLGTPEQLVNPDWRAKYDEALARFEARDFRNAARSLGTLITESVNDGPSIALLSRAVQGLAEGPAADHPVWNLTTK
jgi:adenylate cyclase